MQQIKTTAEYVDLLRSKRPLLIDFYADWCGPCKMLAPHFERAAAAYAGKVVFAKLNVDDAAVKEVVEGHGIDTIPTLIGFKDGVQAASRVGFIKPGELNELAESLAG